MMHELVPGAALTMIDAAGHMPTIEQPTLTNEALQKWLIM
jgi:pimeloyl-ACP methyl ester carboxylesterase